MFAVLYVFSTVWSLKFLNARDEGNATLVVYSAMIVILERAVFTVINFIASFGIIGNFARLLTVITSIWIPDVLSLILVIYWYTVVKRFERLTQ